MARDLAIDLGTANTLVYVRAGTATPPHGRVPRLDLADGLVTGVEIVLALLAIAVLALLVGEPLLSLVGR